MGYSTTTTMHMPRLLHRVLFLFPRNDNACRWWVCVEINRSTVCPYTYIHTYIH